jgi:hypothetical protein
MKSKVFSKGLLYHLKWKVDLKKYIEGRINFNVAEISSEDCMFGKWLRSGEITKYASNLEIRQIGDLHTEIHEIAQRVCELKILGQNTAVRKELKKMETTSMKLNSLLIALRISNNN